MKIANSLSRQIILSMSAVVLCVIALALVGSYVFYALLWVFWPPSDLDMDEWLPSGMEWAWQRFWIPLQKQAPRLVLSLWILGVIASLFSQSYYHWLFTAPAICLLIILEIVIEEVQIDLLLMTEETRYLLDVTHGLYTGTLRSLPRSLRKPGGSCPPSHLHY